MRAINLDGAETTVLKALGSSAGLSGELLADRAQGLEGSELLDTLQSLISLGYVESDKDSLQDLDALKKANFHINSGYLKEIRQALDPSPREPKKSRRVRRE